MRQQLHSIINWRNLGIVLVFMLFAFGLASCDDEDYAVMVTEVQPAYTPQDINPDAGIVGTWQYVDEEHSESNFTLRFTFIPAEENAYTVIVDEAETDKQFSSKFEGHLFRLGADQFLDLYPTSVPEGSEFYFLHFFRCHTVAKIDFPGDGFAMTFLSPMWLAKQIKAGSVTIPHAKSGDILLLTCSTEETQELLFLNANDETAFEEPLLFERASDEEAQ